MARRLLVLLFLVLLTGVALAPASARTTPQAHMGASVYAVCPGTKLKKLDTDLHVLVENAPRNASTVDIIFSGLFLPEVVDPDEDLFKKTFKGTLAADFECGNGSTVKVGSTTGKSLGGDDKHHIVFPIEINLATCPPPIMGWATFDAKGGSVDKKFTGEPVPLNFTLCALVGDGALNFVPSSFSCSIGHPLASECP